MLRNIVVIIIITCLCALHFLDYTCALSSLLLHYHFTSFFFFFFLFFFSRYESVRVRSERNRTQRTERMRSSSARSQAGQGRDGPKTMTRCREEATERDIRARAITGSQRFGCWDSMSIYAREGCMTSLSGDRGGIIIVAEFRVDHIMRPRALTMRYMYLN